MDKGDSSERTVRIELNGRVNGGIQENVRILENVRIEEKRSEKKE